jgi:hypothetical protein
MNANELADMAENACCAYQKEIAAMLRQQQAEIVELKNQLTFITNINRLGFGVQKENGLTSSEIEKVWLSIKEQRDDNFHYGWKKCEQFYGIKKASEK